MLNESQMELLPESMRCWFNEAYCLEAVKYGKYSLPFVQHQPTDICLDGIALQYVQNQTDEICLAAVQQDGLLLRYVQEQTNEICLAAIRQDGYTLRYIRNQTLELCIAAIRKTPQAIIYVQFNQLSSVEIDMLLKEYQLLVLGGNNAN